MTTTVQLVYRNDEGEQIAYAHDLSDEALAQLIAEFDRLAEQD